MMFALTQVCYGGTWKLLKLFGPKARTHERHNKKFYTSKLLRTRKPRLEMCILNRYLRHTPTRWSSNRQQRPITNSSMYGVCAPSCYILLKSFNFMAMISHWDHLFQKIAFVTDNIVNSFILVTKCVGSEEETYDTDAMILSFECENQKSWEDDRD